MGYKELLKAARDQNAARNLVAKYVKLDKEGVEVIGKYMGFVVIPAKKNMPEYKQYLFDTDDGAVKFAPGNNFDGSTGAMMSVGGVYALTYKGKRDIGAGHKVNEWECVSVPADIGDSAEPSDEILIP